MRFDIVKTHDYLLVCDDSEIKVGDWFYNGVLTECTKAVGAWEDKVKYLNANSETFKLISHLPLNGTPVLDDVPLLPSLPKEEDVHEKLKECNKKYIQSLQQPKLPIEFECEMEFNGANHAQGQPTGHPLMDLAIMQNYKPKTIINPKGEVEWVGKYIW